MTTRSLAIQRMTDWDEVPVQILRPPGLSPSLVQRSKSDDDWDERGPDDAEDETDDETDDDLEDEEDESDEDPDEDLEEDDEVEEDEDAEVEVEPVRSAADRDREFRLLVPLESRYRQSDNTGTGGSGSGPAPKQDQSKHPHVASGPKGGQFTAKGGGGSKAPKAKAAPKAAASTPQPPSTPRTMKPGDSGEDVRYAQYAMSLLGFNVPQNGSYDAQTAASVKEIQSRLGMAKPNGHLSASQLHKLQDAVRLSPCVGQSRSFGQDLGETRDLDDAETRHRELALLGIPVIPLPPDNDNTIDGDTRTILDVLDEWVDRQFDDDWDERAHDVSAELRIPGGKGGGRWTKNPIGKAISDALDAWGKGKGPDDPFTFDGKPIDREPLRRAAVARGITLKRGATRDDIVHALLGGVRDEVKTARADRQKRLGSAKFSINVGGKVDPEAAREVEVENHIRAAYAELLAEKPNGASRRLVSLADLRDRLGEENVRGADVDMALKRMITEPGVNLIPESNQSDLTPRLRSASARIGGQDKHHITIADPSPRPMPTPVGGKKIDVAVYTGTSKPAAPVLREVSSANRPGRVITSQDDLAGLEKWANDNGHTDVAEWAKSERARAEAKSAPKAPAKKAVPAAAEAKSAKQQAELAFLDDALKRGESVPGFDERLAGRGSPREMLTGSRDRIASGKLTDAQAVDDVNEVMNSFAIQAMASSMGRSAGGGGRGESPAIQFTRQLNAERVAARDAKAATKAAKSAPRTHQTDTGGRISEAEAWKRMHGDKPMPAKSAPKAPAKKAATKAADAAPKPDRSPLSPAEKAQHIVSDPSLTDRQKRSRLKSAGLAPEEIDRLVPTKTAAKKAIKAAPSPTKVAKATPSAPHPDGLDSLEGPRLKSYAAEFLDSTTGMDDNQLRAALRAQGVGSPAVEQAKRVAEEAAAPKAPSNPLAPSGPDLSRDPEVRMVQVQNRVRAAYQAVLSKKGREPNAWVGLAELRQELGRDVSRGEIDDALIQLSRVGAGGNPNGARIAPETNQKALKQVDREAAVTIGNQPKHVIRIEDPTLRPLPAGGARPKGEGGAAIRSRQLALLDTRAAGHDVTPGHDELHHFWTVGKGRREWVDSPKPWTTLVALLTKHVGPEKAKVYASRWFIEVKGYAAGSDLNRVAHGHPPRGNRVGPG